MLPKNPASIQETLINSLIALNDTGHLTHLINELHERKISQEAEIFILISLCIDSYPEIINHLQRQSLEQLYDTCFSNATPQELFDILERPINSKAKDLLYAYIKQLVSKYKLTDKKKQSTPAKKLLDTFVQFIIEDQGSQSKKKPSNVVKYLLGDYIRFTGEMQKAEKVVKPASNKPPKGA